MDLIYTLASTMPLFLIVWFLLYVITIGLKINVRPFKVALLIGLLKFFSLVWYGISGYPPILLMIQGGLSAMLMGLALPSLFFIITDKMKKRRTRRTR